MRRAWAAVTLVALAACSSGGSPRERALAACKTSLVATTEIGQGTRSEASAIALLSRQEALARKAASADHTYDPIVVGIVGLITFLETREEPHGDPVALLRSQCPSPAENGGT